MGLSLGSLPIGCIVCVCDLTECAQTATLAPTLTDSEFKWGDFSPERYAFRLENVRALRDPVIARGALGFWAVGGDEALEVIRDLKRVEALAR